MRMALFPRLPALPEQMQLVMGSLGGTVANIEKHLKPTVNQIDNADSSAVPTCARAAHLIGRYIKNRQSENGVHSRGGEDRGQPVIVRLEDLPATPHNLERVRESVRFLNQRLASAGAPFRLRLV
jgi:hypothetical protein